MKMESEPGGATVDGAAVSHLERALEESESQVKNYHIRQALQLLIADEQ